MSIETKHTQVETIEYEYPDLGAVEIKLHRESAEVYRFLKKQTEGIEYFERLDQLGALRAVHKSSHHSRWEYMVLQMHLIQQLKDFPAFGFPTSVPLTRKHIVSSMEELLKSWVLLNNYGHLLDTFEAERVWIELMLSEPKLYEAFIGCMLDDTSRKFALRILRGEDLYRFHHLIALVLLSRLSEKGSKSKIPFDLWIEMIKVLLRDTMESTKPKEGSKLDRALQIFNTLRRVSYALLDINRSTLFLRIDSNNLLRNMLKKSDIILYEPESDVSQTIEDIERLLFSEVYASRQACIFKYHYIKGQKREFAKMIERNGIGIFCKNHKIFATQLHQAKINNFGKYQPNPKTKHICRLNLLPNFVFERTDCHFHTEQEKLRKEANIPVDFLITPTPYTKGGSIIDVFIRKNLDIHEHSTLYHTLTKYVVDCYEGWVSDTGSLNFVMSRPLQELFSRILVTFIDSDLRLRFPKGTSTGDSHVDVITSKINRDKWIRRFSQSLKAKTLARDRTWELTASLQLLRRQKGELFLIAISNIHLYNPDGTREVEWDGVFFNIKKDDIILYIVEAKRGKTRKSQECSNALLDSIDKAGIRLKQGKFTIRKCNGYAYTKVALTDITLPTLL